MLFEMFIMVKVMQVITLFEIKVKKKDFINAKQVP